MATLWGSLIEGEVRKAEKRRYVAALFKQWSRVLEVSEMGIWSRPKGSREREERKDRRGNGAQDNKWVKGL